MHDRQVKIAADSKSMFKTAAKDFMETVVSAVSKRGEAFVGLSGGSTPRGLFKLLTQSPYREVIPWDTIHFFWADERLVKMDDPESNSGQAQQLLFQYVPVDPNKIHPVIDSTQMLSEGLEPKSAARAYAETLKKVAPEGREFPCFDWLLLGMGADGHTASLFPGSEPDPEEVVIAVQANYEGRPAHRVSLTPRILNEARQILFLVNGRNKADILLEVLHGPPDLYNLPAQRIQPTHGRLVWMLDREAASRLKYQS